MLHTVGAGGGGGLQRATRGQVLFGKEETKDGDRPSPRRRQRGAGWEGLLFTVLTLCVIRVL